MGVIDWSKTAADNNDSDASINWSEGMAPSAVNDSARAMMASVAEWRDDLGGTIETGGSATAYTVTSNQSFGSLSQGLVIAFIPHITNGANPTLNVDGLGAKPLRSSPGSSGELGAGVLIQGTPYVATYFTSNSGEWILHSFYDSIPTSVPIGAILPYAGTSAPSARYVFPYGQAISRTTYATLFGRLGTIYGNGDGSTTFNLPDLRGRVIAGLDNMGGTSADRLTNQSGGVNGDALGATGGSETHTLTTAQLAPHSHNVNDSGHSHFYLHQNGGFFTDNLGSAGETASASTAGVSTSVSFTNITIQNAGGGAAHNNVQPTIVLPYLIRVL